MTHTTLAQLVTEQAGSRQDQPILTFVEVGADGALLAETRSYAQLLANATALARWLQAKGVGKGDRFAIMMHNHPEFVEAMLAAALTGAVFVPIDPRTMGDKLAYMLDFSECAGLLVADYCAGLANDVAAGLAHLRWVVVVGDAKPAATDRLGQVTPYAATQTADGALVPVEVTSGDPFFMMYTSGTTGNPKAVVQTHGEYMAPTATRRPFGIGEGDCLYTGLSLTHINAQGTVRMGLALGVPVVVSRKFTKSRLWDICRAYGCTVFNLLGGMIPEMFGVPETPDDADNPVRMIVSAGMPVALWTAYEARFGVRIFEIYGSTEGAGALFNPPGVGPVGSMGKPPKGLEAAVFGEDGAICAPHVPGELRFRPAGAEARAAAYYKNEEAGRGKIVGGWFATGDIVHQDEQGWFFFHHRVGGGVRRNGAFVNTALVEAVLARSPQVADVFVYGVSTKACVAGEKRLVAAIVAADAASFDLAALREFCRVHLEANDVPEIFQLLDAIPKTISEKPIEKACLALLEGHAELA